MRAAILAAALSSVALAWDTSSSASSQAVASVSNPAVPYLTQTNSLGVVTGQPTPIRSQSPAASIPAGLSSVPVVPGASSIVPKPLGTGSSGSKSNSTRTSTTLSTSAGVTRTASGSGSTGTSSGSSSSAASTNGAIMATAAPAGLGLGLAGAVFAAFL
ncbi:hypothetical protein C8Q69DRAFT_467155 [Paecilomyces variotii]|uniref:GPI anchored protein n=1 Tax=Byssochlamys spectabilis TaxID=264951 RepID=A0A443HV65_BYSSP|nr:hypothetical protein C8Q69DRAFT_467155 [Paecilomyces variotii]KAJ9360240.1 hypothetical protein DTO280E4_4462 [Paecilomyces variotii]RWQ95725.1 hypothetical protein C8Q69DRAFT_467155 [Paecilomyces variotii]